jgi:dTDP-4-dehydrorhamnose reductase
MNYNFKNFFKQNKISNTEYACNAHFIIKRSVLTKAQNNYIDTFIQDTRTDNMMKIYNDVIGKESNYIIEFVPALLGRIVNKEEEYNIVINSNNTAIKEEYYNFFKAIKCRLFYDTKKGSYEPLTVYNRDNEVVGMVFLEAIVAA